MKKSISHIRANLLNSTVLTVGVLIVVALFLYKLGSLIPRFSPTEYQTANSVLGFHGFFYHIFYLPLEMIRSIFFAIFPSHGYFTTRLPNAIFGILSIAIFSYIVYQWHGKRVALLATLLFSCSAWMLHVSRLASYDVMYAFSMLTIILVTVLIKKYKTHPYIFVLSGLLLGIAATTPGVIWLVLLALLLIKDDFIIGWKHLNNSWQKIVFTVVSMSFIPLIAFSIIKHGGLLNYFGLPSKFDGIVESLKHLIGAPVHLFIRGPQYPELWLGRQPVLDIFVLITVFLGIYFYAHHRSAARSKVLLVMLTASLILTGLGGPVSLSAAVATAFLLSATGIAYLLRDWLTMFPINPIARLLGISVVAVAVLLSCSYGIRSYFVAWPNNTETNKTFIYKK